MEAPEEALPPSRSPPVQTKSACTRWGTRLLVLPMNMNTTLAVDQVRPGTITTLVENHPNRTSRRILIALRSNGVTWCKLQLPCRQQQMQTVPVAIRKAILFLHPQWEHMKERSITTAAPIVLNSPAVCARSVILTAPYVSA